MKDVDTEDKIMEERKLEGRETIERAKVKYEQERKKERKIK